MRVLHYLALLFVLPLSFATAFAQQPVDAFQIGSVSVPSSIDLSNVSSRDLCVNTYVFDKKDDSFVSCCTSILSPNQAYTMKTQIGPGTTGTIAPTSLTIKLVATAPVVIGSAKLCGLATPTSDDLVTGLRASVNGNSFTPSQLSNCVVTSPGQPCRTELLAMGLFCGFLKATGSGFGFCQETIPVQSSTSNEEKTAEMWQWSLFFH